MSLEPQLIADYACATGEGPLWHPDEQCLYWVDIPAGRLFRYFPDTDAHEQVLEGEDLGGFTIQADGSLLLFMARGAVKVWRDGIRHTILDEIPDERETRFNDVIADPLGRVFCGTMPTGDRLGRLYRLDPDGSLALLLEGCGCPNGLGFTPDRRGLYFTDSPKREIYLFDYDEDTGAITNRRVFVRMDEEEGAPDGMTVDAEGYVWSAVWDGNRLVRLAPDGVEVCRIAFPAKKVASVTFGGPDYTDIYVATAGGNDKDSEGPGAGGLFRLNAGVRGVPEFRSRIGL